MLCANTGYTLSEGQVFIAVTHDCSVIQPSLQHEPHLEWLLAKPIENGHGHFRYARNIRRLHLEIEVEGYLRWFEVGMALRGFASREGLDGCSSDKRYSIDGDNLNILKRWLGNRYTTQTFPDDFNDRIKPLIEGSSAPLIKMFNTAPGEACRSLYLTLNPFDRGVEDGENYELTVAALFRDEVAMDIGRELMDQFAANIEALLRDVKGFGDVTVLAFAESDLSHAQVLKMARWQLDYVSLADGDEVVVADQS